MPRIEIISLRFNLDKEEDGQLFEVLQKKADAGKRNDFLKRILCEALLRDGSSGGGKTPRLSKKPPREPVEVPVEQPTVDVSNKVPREAPSIQITDMPQAESSGSAKVQTDLDVETSEFVRSLVQ